MATKKGKRSTSSKKSSPKATSAKKTAAENLEAKVTTADPEVTEEVVEVVEIEEPIAEKSARKKLTIMDKLADLNPAALIAELLGTFVLTAIFIQLIGNGYYGPIIIALVLAAIVIAFIGISGAHFNPAITLAQWICRKINGVKAIAYIVAQVLGAILAFFVLTGINNAGYDFETAVRQAAEAAGASEEMYESAGGYDAWVDTYYGGTEGLAEYLGVSDTAPELFQYEQLVKNKEWVALLAEVLGSIIVGLGAGYAYNKRKDNKVAAGLAMGLSLIAGLFIAGSTAILNPAIATTMGVFVWGEVTAFLWPILVYVLGSILGATLGFFVYNMLAKNEEVNAKAIED